MFKSVLFGAVSAIAIIGSANAADLYRGPAAGGFKDGPYVPVATWTGFYAGINGGYAWDASDIGSALSPFDIKPEGGFGGGQIGYNWQGALHPHLVIGVEADFQGADISDEVKVSGGNAYVGIKSSLDWFGTVRGRLGYAFDNTLVYATGGFAYGKITDEISAGYTVRKKTFAASYSEDNTSTGYVVGGGLEHKFSPNWSVKAEYQYIDLGKDSGWAKVADENYTLHTARVGLNYHFNTFGGYEPLK